MGLMTGALQIGRSALLAYQSALQVVGNNISNAGSPGYTRQTPVLTPMTGSRLPEGFIPGGGVALSSLQRNIDSSLENRMRVALGDKARAEVEQYTLGRIEGVMNELSDSDLSTFLQEFFNSFSALQNQPHDLTARSTALTAGDSLINELKRQRHSVLTLRDELNQSLIDSASRANELTKEIAGLNVQISAMESTSAGLANALRDQRDVLLSELGEIIQIEVREQPNSGVNVYVGNELLIQSGLNRGITTTLETIDEHPRVVVRFADNNGTITIRGGRMEGLITARDTDVLGQVKALDGFAQALISEVNKVHADGQGLEGFTEVTGAFDVLDSTAVLNSTAAGLKATPGNGSFLITVTDQNAGTSITTTITVDLDGIGTDDSLAILAARINAKVNSVTAQATADNRFKLTADTGFEFTFSQDSSNVLAALGVNVFFTGSNANDMVVNATLVNNPDLVAAATQNTPGDGSNAARIAALGTNALSGLRGRSLTEYYNSIASNVAVRGAAAMAGVQAADAITSSLIAQHESISGVSLDEEAISLLRLERSFQAAARYSSVVNRLIQEMLSIVR